MKTKTNIASNEKAEMYLVTYPKHSQIIPLNNKRTNQETA